MEHDHANPSNPVNISLIDMDFEWIYKVYFLVLCRYAEGLVKPKEEAEDIVSNLFLVLWENRESIQITRSLKSFLYQGVRNNSLKFLQHKKVICKYREHIRNMHANEDWLLIYDNNDPISIRILQDLEHMIDDAIKALPEKCREIFDLVRFEELKYQEVADRLGISVGTVRKQVNRAMKKLRESFENI